MPSRRTVNERWECTCGAKLIGAAGKSSGPVPSVQPITVEAHPNGNVLLARDERGVLRGFIIGKPDVAEYLRGMGVQLRLNHFADCPDRERYERSSSS